MLPGLANEESNFISNIYQKLERQRILYYLFDIFIEAMQLYKNKIYLELRGIKFHGLLKIERKFFLELQLFQGSIFARVMHLNC